MGEQPACKQAEQQPLSSLPAELESSEEEVAANSLVLPAAGPVMSSSSREKKTCEDRKEKGCSVLMGALFDEEKMPDLYFIYLLSNFSWTALNIWNYSKFKMFVCFHFTENHNFTLEIKILKNTFYLSL